MKPLNVQIAELMDEGYSSDTAQAKVAHDIVLLAMHRCGLKAHSTIKGGVVISSNRPKDIFDMHYLSGVVDKELLKKYITLIIYGNPKCRIDDHAEMMRALRLTFALKTFSRKLTVARANWLQLPGPQVLESLTEYLEGLI